jgi:hypothetical protein
VALSLVLTIAPFAIVAPFLGPAIDRLQGGRKFIILGTATGRVASCLFMAASVHSLLLFPAAFFSLVFSKAHAVAKSAMVPAVVASDDELADANAKLTVGSAVAGLLVAIPGVAILKLFDAAAVLRVASLVFVAAAIAAVRIVPARVDRHHPPTDAGEENKRMWGITLAAGVMGVIRFTAGFLTFLLAFHFRHTKAPSYWYGIVLGLSVGGGLLGAALAPRLRNKVRAEQLVIGALLLIAVGAIVAVAIGGRGGAALISAVIGLSAGAGKLAFDSLVQRDAHESLHGRTFARFEAGFQLMWVLGALVPVLLHISDTPGFVVIAVTTAGAATAYVFFRMRPPPETVARVSG